MSDAKLGIEGGRGPRGDRGHRGHRGHDGHDGSTGSTGATGPAGDAGTRTALISPWSGTSDLLPAGGNSAGPQLQANQSWRVPVTANAGEQVTAFSFWCFGDGAVDLAWSLFLFDYPTNTNTLLASGTVVNVPAAWTETPVVVNTPVEDNQALIFFFQPNAAGLFAGLISADIGPQP